MDRSRGLSLGILATGILLFVSGGVFIILLYIVPGFTPWGMNGVWVQSRFMTYFGPEMDHIFNQRNMIIESSRAEIIVRVRTQGFGDEARVQVFENANGVSFNSLSRTHIDFLETLDEDGVPATRIIVREPRGVMTRTARVFINIPSDRIGDAHPYNFVFNTGASRVTIEADPTITNHMQIDNLTITGTGHVLIHSATTANQFDVRVANMTINSHSANVVYRGHVTESVRINGSSRNITLGAIGTAGVARPAPGAALPNLPEVLHVTGFSHNIGFQSAEGHVLFDSTRGSLNVGDAIWGELEISHSAAVIDLNAHTIGRLVVPNLPTGSISISRITSTSYVRMQTGHLNLGVRGADLGVFGNVFVHKYFGGVNVTFANSNLATGSLFIRAHDGQINAHGTRGHVDVEISSMGMANVRVAFASIVNNSRIIVQGSRQPGGIDNGRIDVVLLSGGSGVTMNGMLHIRGAYNLTGNMTLPTTGFNCTNSDHGFPGQTGYLPDDEIDAGCIVLPFGISGRSNFFPWSPTASQFHNVIHLLTHSSININTGSSW